MKPEELKKGDRIFFIKWDPIYYKVKKIEISEVNNVSSKRFYKTDHVDVNLYPIIGDEEYYIFYEELDLDKINLEIYDVDVEFIFTTINEKLFVELLSQLIKNRTYDKSMIKRTLQY